MEFAARQTFFDSLGLSLYAGKVTPGAPPCSSAFARSPRPHEEGCERAGRWKLESGREIAFTRVCRLIVGVQQELHESRMLVQLNLRMDQPSLPFTTSDAASPSTSSTSSTTRTARTAGLASD